jgi:cytoskeletal protein CcmA (bactofilin family)
MHFARTRHQNGNALLCALLAIIVLSTVGANVLMNCTTRYNAASNGVRGWKQALYAAESGGDVAFNEIRKSISDPLNCFTTGWTNTIAISVGAGLNVGSGGLSLSSNASLYYYHSSPPTTLGSDGLSTTSRVDLFLIDAVTGNPWYRIRTQGTAPVRGLNRVGMDDRVNATTRGDSLVRKIDFRFDHFIAAYGPDGDGLNKALVPVTSPKITRRIELTASPVTPFDAAIKVSGSFYGLGSAAMIDSYNSANGPYRFVANDPSDPDYPNSHSGNVEIGTAVATFMGTVYGNVATNGGTIVRSDQIHGTIDNNVPINIPPFKLPSSLPLPQITPPNILGNITITPPVAGTALAPTLYVLSSLSSKVTVNAIGGAETFVALHVTGDITGKITVNPNVHLQVYFDGNLQVKAQDIINNTDLAGNLQFYGISPSDPSATQTIEISPPGNFAGTIYAPGADLRINGNPDITGSVVAKSFYANGNVSWHYDRALNLEGNLVDFRIASYVEDTR